MRTEATPRSFRIAVLVGDGVGPEVVAEALKVLRAAAGSFGLDYSLEELPFGGAAVDQTGLPFPPGTRRACLEADVVLMGAVGGPGYDRLPAELRPERGLLDLRQALGAYANVRPVRLPASLARLSPLRPEVVAHGVDIVFVRELTGGLYFGPKRLIPPEKGRPDDELAAEDVMRYSVREIRRVAEVAFRLAAARAGRLTSVDKENVLVTSRLWRETVSALAPSFPEVRLRHLYADNCGLQLVRDPGQFDVIVTENTFGDILTDIGGAIVGSLGLLPSASLGGRTGLYEPVHGSAPDIAGRGLANPAGAILGLAMMARYSFDREDMAQAIDSAVTGVLEAGHLPADLGGATGTERFGDLVAAAVSGGLPTASAPTEPPSLTPADPTA